MHQQEDSYGNKFHQLTDITLREIIDSPDVRIVITDTWDDLCKVCRRRDKCDYQHEGETDLAMVTKLGFRIGQSLTSGELLEKMQRREELIQCVIDEIIGGSKLGKYLQTIYSTLF